MIRSARAGLMALCIAAPPALAQSLDGTATLNMLDRAQTQSDRATGSRLLESHEVRGHSRRTVRPDSSPAMPTIADKVGPDAMRKRNAGDAAVSGN